MVETNDLLNWFDVHHGREYLGGGSIIIAAPGMWLCSGKIDRALLKDLTLYRSFRSFKDVLAVLLNAFKMLWERFLCLI